MASLRYTGDLPWKSYSELALQDILNGTWYLDGKLGTQVLYDGIPNCPIVDKDIGGRKRDNDGEFGHEWCSWNYVLLNQC